MRLDFTNNCGCQRWITRFIYVLCIQTVYTVLSCDENQYMHNGKCCDKCQPGMRLLKRCSKSSDTQCGHCELHEYQPDWNLEEKCLPQKFCDEVRGFIPERPVNRTAAVPCRCLPGLQCHVINCEYCEKAKVCAPGYGFISRGLGQGSCEMCRIGYFSNASSADPCKPWTDCTALGKDVIKPGTTTVDVTCGNSSAATEMFSGASNTWVAVVILLMIIVASLSLLFLFFCNDKWKSLSVNIAACVQTMKSRVLHREALPTPYHSVRSPCDSSLEVTCLIMHEKSNSDCLVASTNDNLHPPRGQELSAVDKVEGEGSNAEPLQQWVSPSPPRPEFCGCGLSVKGPMEVGENEDFSQAMVSCPCGKGGVTREPTLPPHLRNPHFDCTAAHVPCSPCTDMYGRVTEDALGGVRTVEGGNERAPRSSADLETSVSNNNPSLCRQGNSGSNLGPEPAGPARHLTSGHVTGNGNTTFISNGQVLNFSGEVLVVCVSQESLGGKEEPEESIRSPVQEEITRGSLKQETASTR